MTKEDYYFEGVDLFSEGKLEEAIAAYQKALEEDPAFTDALHGLAQAYFAKGDFDSSLATAQRKGMIREAEEAGNKARILGWKKQLQEQKAKGQSS